MLFSNSGAGKTTSNWLDRLRSSKGFPSTTDLDLDRFLAHQNHDTNTTSISSTKLPRAHPPTSYCQVAEGNTNMCSVMSNLLSELFVMGDSDHLPKFPCKKCSRKQPNPRFCVALNSSDSDNNNSFSGEIGLRKNESASPMSDDNSGVGMVKETRSSDEQLKLVEDVKFVQEEGGGGINLSSFSKTQVTVIDTSVKGWKFEKMLFRKNNLWKVRDSKGKNVVNLGKKKRKADATPYDMCSRHGLKLKALNQQDTCTFLEEGRSGEEYSHSDELETAYTQTSGAIVDKGPQKKRATLISAKGSSSIILLKSVTASKKRGTSSPSPCNKLSQRQTKY